MTVRQSSSAVRWSLPLMASALMLSSCTHPAVRSAQPSTSPASVPQIAQIGYGTKADFMHCVPPQCPERTPKTLGAAPTSETSAAAAPEAIPPVAAVAPIVPSEATPEAHGAGVSPVAVEQMTWSVPFAFGSAQPGPAAQTVLLKVLDELPGKSHLTIAGRTDNTGPGPVSDALAQARAEAVRDHLLRSRPELAPAITVQAQGKCCFAASNDTATGRARNRRVEIVAELPASPP